MKRPTVPGPIPLPSTSRLFCLVVTHDTGDTDYHYHPTMEGALEHAGRCLTYRYVENVRIDKPTEIAPSYDPAITEQLPPPPAEILIEEDR